MLIKVAVTINGKDCTIFEYNITYPIEDIKVLIKK
jgi:hypothetical protein